MVCVSVGVSVCDLFVCMFGFCGEGGFVGFLLIIIIIIIIIIIYNILLKNILSQ